MRRLVVPIAMLAALAGCSWTSQVKKRAAFDLNCPEDRVDVETLSSFGAQYGARGCDKQASYVVRNGQVLLNSPIQSNAPQAPQAGGESPPEEAAR